MKIIRDHREKKSFFTFANYDDVECSRSYIETGDYTIRGHEFQIAIERKRSTGELYNNIYFKKKKKTFIEEFDRMCLIPHSYLILQFPEAHFDIFPTASTINHKYHDRINVSGGYLLSFLKNQCKRSNTELLFSNSVAHSEEQAYEILKEYYEEYV